MVRPVRAALGAHYSRQLHAVILDSTPPSTTVLPSGSRRRDLGTPNADSGREGLTLDLTWARCAPSFCTALGLGGGTLA